MLLDPIHSISKFSFYQTVPRKSIGETVGYILYLSLLFSVCLTASMVIQLRPRIAEAIEWVATTLPTMTLSGGKLTSSLKEPLLIRHPKAPDAAFIIDTNRTDAVTAAEMEQKKVRAYVTQTSIAVLTDRDLETYDLSKSAVAHPVVLDADFYRKTGGTFNKLLYPIAFFTTWLIFLVWKHLSALLYSLLALLINAAVSGSLDFPELYKISVYAQTPVVGLQIAALFFPRPIPFFNLLAIIIVGLYIWQALRQQPAHPEVQTI